MQKMPKKIRKIVKRMNEDPLIDLRSARIELGYSQEQIAKAVGVANRTISCYEKQYAAWATGQSMRKVPFRPATYAAVAAFVKHVSKMKPNQNPGKIRRTPHKLEEEVS